MNQVLALLEQAKYRIIILPGGGLKAAHVPRLKETGYLKEVHASCKLAKPADNQFVKPYLSFASAPLDFSLNFGIDPQLVKEFKSIL